MSTPFFSIVMLIVLTTSGCVHPKKLTRNHDEVQLSEVTSISKYDLSQGILEQRDHPYFCQEVKTSNRGENLGYPTIFARSDLGNIPIIEYRSDYKPLERCNIVADRLTKLHKENCILYLAWMRQPGGEVIYVTKLEGDVYRSEKYLKELFTLIHPDDQPHIIMRALKGIASTIPADTKPIEQ